MPILWHPLREEQCEAGEASSQTCKIFYLQLQVQCDKVHFVNFVSFQHPPLSYA